MLSSYPTKISCHTGTPNFDNIAQILNGALKFDVGQTKVLVKEKVQSLLPNTKY